MQLANVVAARTRAASSLDPEPLVACLGAMAPKERVPGVVMMSGRLPCGPLGISVRRLQEHVRRHVPHGEGPGLSVLHAAEGLQSIRGRRGMGAEKRLERARTLFEAATREESDFLLKLAANRLRSPTVDRLVVQAIATAGALDPALVWQAVQVSSDLAATAKAAFGEGEAGLQALVAETKPGARRDPELEAMILEYPDNPDAAAVYGDWLLQHDQPHGHLIAAVVVPVRAEQRKRAWSKALKRFVRQEGLGSELFERLVDSSVSEWRHGFLRRLWLPGQTTHAPDLAEAVLRLLGGSVAMGLNTLGVDIDEVITIPRLPALAALHRLRLDIHSTPACLDLTELSIHPELRHLQLAGSLEFADRDLSGIRSLSIDRLDLQGTYDLSPLAGVDLTTVVLLQANHVDLRPLVALPALRTLGWGQRRSPDVELVSQLAHLEELYLRHRPSAALATWAASRKITIGRLEAVLSDP